MDISEKTFDDGYEAGHRVNFSAAATTSSDAVRFTLPCAAVVDVWWVSGAGSDKAARSMVALNSAGTQVASSAESSNSTQTPMMSTLTLGAGTYYLGGDVGKNFIYKVQVTLGEAQSITALAAVDGVEVDFGTAKDAAIAELPGTLTATLADGTTQSVTIRWDCESYDGTVERAEYTFIGTPTALPSLVKNGGAVTATATVTVGRAQAYSIQQSALNGGTVTGEVAAVLPSTASFRMLCAQYADGRMQDVRMDTVAVGEDFSFTFEQISGAVYKLFLLDSAWSPQSAVIPLS